MDIIEVLSHPDTTTILEDKPNYFRYRYTLQEDFLLDLGLDQAGGDYEIFGKKMKMG